MSSTPPYSRADRWLLVGGIALAVALAVGGIGWTSYRVAARLTSGEPLWAGDKNPTKEPTVLHVVDGDTIVVQTGLRTDKVRLLGIDTPETKDPRKPVQCYGEEASARTKELLPAGTIVHLVRDVEERDRYDRVLAYVYRAADGLFVNLELARGGFADLLTYPPNVAHTAELQGAVAEARREQRGLWQACGGPGRPA
jgi:micrococcal nuclease